MHSTNHSERSVWCLCVLVDCQSTACISRGWSGASRVLPARLSNASPSKHWPGTDTDTLHIQSIFAGNQQKVGSFSPYRMLCSFWRISLPVWLQKSSCFPLRSKKVTLSSNTNTEGLESCFSSWIIYGFVFQSSACRWRSLQARKSPAISQSTTEGRVKSLHPSSPCQHKHVEARVSSAVKTSPLRPIHLLPHRSQTSPFSSGVLM